MQHTNITPSVQFPPFESPQLTTSNSHHQPQQILDYYDSLIKTLQIQRDSCANKLKSCPHSSSQPETQLPTIQTKQSLQSQNPNLIWPIQYHKLESYFQQLCSGIRKLWAPPSQLTPHQFISSRKEIGWQNFNMKINKRNGNKYQHTCEINNLNSKKIIQEQNINNLTEINLSPKDNIIYLKYYTPKLSKVYYKGQQAISHLHDFTRAQRHQQMGRGARNHQFHPPPPLYNDFLMQHAFLPPPKEQSEALHKKNLQLISENKNITSLKISSLTPSEEQIFVDLMPEYFNHLKQLNFDNTTFEFAPESFERGIKACSNIESFTLSVLHFNFVQRINLTPLAHLHNLKSLCLSNLQGQHLTLDFSTLKNLTKISLISCAHIFNSSIKEIASIQTLKSVKIHHYNGNEYQYDDYYVTSINSEGEEIQIINPDTFMTLRSLLSLLHSSESLEQLDISEFYRDGCGEFRMAEDIVKIGKINKLLLPYNLTEYEPIILLCKRLDLRVLDVALEEQVQANYWNNNNQRGEGEELSLGVEKCFEEFVGCIPNIVELRLGISVIKSDGHWIKDRGVMLISKQLKSLKLLSVMNCGFSQTGVYYVSKLPYLHSICLGPSSFSSFSSLPHRPMKILLNCSHLKQLRTFNPSSSYMQVKNHVRNQYLKISQSIVNLKTIVKGSEFEGEGDSFNFFKDQVGQGVDEDGERNLGLPMRPPPMMSPMMMPMMMPPPMMMPAHFYAREIEIFKTCRKRYNYTEERKCRT